MREEPRSEPQAHEHQGRDADARRLVDDVPPLPRDPAAASRGRGVHPDREAHLPGVRRRRLSHRVLRGGQRVHRARRARRRGGRVPLLRRSRRRVRRRASGSRTCPRSCTCARTRRSSPRPRVGTRTSGRGSPRRSASRWRGACPPSPAPAIRPRRPAGPSDRDALTCTHAVTNAQCWRGVRGFARVPASPYRGDAPVRMCCCWMSMLFTRRVQQGPKRPGRRSPHMNRRAFRLVLFSLVVATVGSSGRTRCRHRRPDRRQAGRSRTARSTDQQQRREAQRAERADQLRADRARRGRTPTSAAADALVAAAKAKTQELRAEVARRAAVGLHAERLDRRCRGTRRARTRRTCRRARSTARSPRSATSEIVHSLAKAKEQVTERKADAEDAAPGRAEAAGRDQGAEGEARRRPGRARAAAVEGHRRDRRCSCSRPSRNARRVRPRRPREQYAAAAEPAGGAGAGRGGGNTGGGGSVGGGGSTATPPPSSGGVARGARVRLRAARQAVLLRRRRARAASTARASR